MSFFATWYVPAGLLIGLFAAAPIGPVNVLVIQRTLQRGAASAVVLGLGAALGDACFAGIAALGLGFIKALLNTNQHVLRVAGGLFIIAFGAVLWRQSPHLDGPLKPLPKAKHLAAAIFIMTLTNPATILWFIAAFAMFRFEALGHATRTGLIHSGQLIIGVFAGSMIWWVGLSNLVIRWRSNFTDRHLVIMNHSAAAILVLSGILALLTTWF